MYTYDYEIERHYHPENFDIVENMPENEEEKPNKEVKNKKLCDNCGSDKIRFSYVYERDYCIKCGHINFNSLLGNNKEE